MKVCIVGAGAIGGLIGARLAASTDCQVSALARGETLAALNAEGWRLKQGDRLVTGKAHASSDARELGPQDLVVVAVKAPSMAPIAAQIGALLKPDTIVLPAMNGVPWWFSQGLPAVGEQPLQSVDPGGAIARAIPLRHLIGCVVHLSAATTEPGLVQHRNGMGLIVGEPDGSTSARLDTLHELLAKAGFDVTSSDAIRHDIWYKLWGNMTMNPVSAITGATGDRMLDDPLVRGFCSAVMREGLRHWRPDRLRHRPGSGSTPRDHARAGRLQDVHAGRCRARQTDRTRRHRDGRARTWTADRRSDAEHRRPARAHASLRANPRFAGGLISPVRARCPPTC